MGQYDFDHPDAFDFDALGRVLQAFSDGKPAQVPLYDFVESVRVGEETVYPKKFIVVEGILLFHDKKIRDMLALRIFVDVDMDVCLLRRIRRDTTKRGRSVEYVLAQYETYVKPAFEMFIKPGRVFAHVIVQNNGMGRSKSEAFGPILDLIRFRLTRTGCDHCSECSQCARSDRDNMSRRTSFVAVAE